MDKQTPKHTEHFKYKKHTTTGCITETSALINHVETIYHVWGDVIMSTVTSVSDFVLVTKLCCNVDCDMVTYNTRTINHMN